MNLVQSMKIKGYINKFDIPIGEICKLCKIEKGEIEEA